MGWKIGLETFRMIFILENSLLAKMVFYGSGAVRREVSFRMCGRQDDGSAVYGGDSIL